MSCEVAHELLGPTDGPPVILSCSLGTDRSMWDPQTPALAESHLVVRYDLRGHGQSPAPPGPYAISDLGEDLLALMDRLEIERASLCGVSIGGDDEHLGRPHTRPSASQRLVLCCTSARFGPEAADVYRARAETVREHTVDAVADGALERWFTPGVPRGAAGADGADPQGPHRHLERGLRRLLRGARGARPASRARLDLGARRW